MKKQGLIAGFAIADAMAVGAAAFAVDTAPSIGERMPDGTVYSGISPDTNKPIYTTLKEAPGTYNWDKGAAYCSAVEAYGDTDWRVPTHGELNVLFQNRAAIGGFNQAGDPERGGGGYWTSTPDRIGYGHWRQRFSDGEADDRGPL
jgi:hypothetical protein